MAVTRGPSSLSLSLRLELGWVWFPILALALAAILPVPQALSQAAPKSPPKVAPKTPSKLQNPAKPQKKVTEEERLQQLYDSARTFQLSGDSERASTAYTAFLTEALRS